MYILACLAITWAGLCFTVIISNRSPEVLSIISCYDTKGFHISIFLNGLYTFFTSLCRPEAQRSFVQCLSPCSITYFVYNIFIAICLNYLFIAMKECHVLGVTYWGKLDCLLGSQKFKFRWPSSAKAILGVLC